MNRRQRAVRRAFLLEISTFPLTFTRAYFVCKFIHSCLRLLPLPEPTCCERAFTPVQWRSNRNKTKDGNRCEIWQHSSMLTKSTFLAPTRAFRITNVCLIMGYHYDTMYQSNESIFDTIQMNWMWLWLQAIYGFKWKLHWNANVEQKNSVNKQRISSIVLFYYRCENDCDWILLHIKVIQCRSLSQIHWNEHSM